MEKLTSKDFLLMVENGCECLGRNRKTVDDLNVFPVPDGDTGANMFMTISAGVKNTDENCRTSLGASAKAVAKGMFMGARGNSGVILSRIFAGIAKGFEGLQDADLQQIIRAFENGVKESYSAVAKPVEGTMLTVFREASENACKAENIDGFFELFNKGLKKSLEKTPELLPVLSDNGVVDSGGAGLVYIFQGFMSALRGEVLASGAGNVSGKSDNSDGIVDFSLFGPDSQLEYGYCTEFMLRLQNSKVDGNFDEKVLFDWLYENGDSVVAFRDDSIIKVHIHTRTPGQVLNHCQQYGEFLKLKIENMTLQHHEATIQNNYKAEEESDETEKLFHVASRKSIGTVAVAAGEGVVNLFSEIGVDYVVPGGQSMNPSVQDFIDAFRSVNADSIIVLPNNSNVILTARQASSLYTQSNVVILPTRTIGEGYGALTAMDTEGKAIDEIVSGMMEAVRETVTGFVAKANRSTVVDGVDVTSGHYLGFTDDEVFVDAENRTEAAVKLAQKLNAGDYGVMLVLSGKDVLDSSEGRAEIDGLKTLFEDKFRDLEVISDDGMQPIYDYILILQ